MLSLSRFLLALILDVLFNDPRTANSLNVSAMLELEEDFDYLLADSGMQYTLEELTQHREDFLAAHRAATKEVDGKPIVASGPSGGLTRLFWKSRPMLIKSLADALNRDQKSWVASSEQERFKGASVSDVETLCGTILNGPSKLPKKSPSYPSALNDLPDSFDAREHFKNCSHVIGHVRDQSTCGSCWAFATSEAFSDRLCIRSGGQYDMVPLSAGHTAACCSEAEGCFSFGCDGGQPDSAWRWFSEHGVVSGGDYQPDMQTFAPKLEPGCWPYDFPECAHHVDVKGMQPCKGNRPSPTCSTQCRNHQYKPSFDGDRHYTEDEGYSLDQVDEIKKEIIDNGPVAAAFTVYEDFPYYKSGVYKHVRGSELGGHAVKIIGWGVEQNEQYWLVMNSWNVNWGDKGTFKIAFGECGIDSEVTAGVPRDNKKSSRGGTQPEIML
ncbi:hypothetical protein FOZ63_022752 [Perkinsus olseni]|uniref:Peptidase C1A papain C-terminal domain-containing protein n=1 Tax=Perkinsus olseni TaxID=32597 RepID=A0A7J6R5R0_PEROL|nr:hypothetical protein FOZ63_022752 [Perkinsus olseni]